MCIVGLWAGVGCFLEIEGVTLDVLRLVDLGQWRQDNIGSDPHSSSL